MSNVDFPPHAAVTPCELGRQHTGGGRFSSDVARAHFEGPCVSGVR